MRQQKTPEQDDAAQAYLSQLRDRIPTAMETLDSSLVCGEEPKGGPRCKTVQACDDAAEVAGKEAARLLGASLGRACRQSLEYDFTALTANHHGAEFHPEFVQGNLLFALRRSRALSAAPFAPVAPVFSFGAVSLNNYSFPRGITVGRPESASSTLPRRLPVISGKKRWLPVCLSPPFAAADVARAEASLHKKNWSDALLPFEKATIRRILSEVFLDRQVLKQSRYTDQAVLMNSLIWQRLFEPGLSADSLVPPLITLEIERLVKPLLIKDLSDPYSLVHFLLLEAECRERLLPALADVRGCWPKEILQSHTDAPHKGTFFFWGIDRNRRRFSLAPCPSGRGKSCDVLAGVDAYGEKHCFPLESKALVEALQDDRLLPGLYLVFAVLHLARGLNCGGGVFQIDYLRLMRQGTAQALTDCNEPVMAGQVASAPGGMFSTGFLPLRFKDASGANYAAGPVEIMANGGLRREQWHELADLSVAEAFRCSLAYLYQDLVEESSRTPRWFEHLYYPGGILLGTPKRAQ